MIVVDTNVMTHLLMGGEGSADAALLFEQDPEWAAPVILMSELRDVLLGFVRHGALVSDQAKAMSDAIWATVLQPYRARRYSMPLECGLTVRLDVALARTLIHFGRRNHAGRRGRVGVVTACGQRANLREYQY